MAPKRQRRGREHTSATTDSAKWLGGCFPRMRMGSTSMYVGAKGDMGGGGGGNFRAPGAAPFQLGAGLCVVMAAPWWGGFISVPVFRSWDRRRPCRCPMHRASSHRQTNAADAVRRGPGTSREEKFAAAPPSGRPPAALVLGVGSSRYAFLVGPAHR